MINNKYLVLARKYRPQKFSDLKGQDDIVQILKGAIENNRLAHAYLLSGTRGVGKTTLARLIAKIVNCLSRAKINNFDSCGTCENCNSINSSSNIDVVEIDAASKTGVSDVREIIENVNYKAVSALKKVFIIDEVHMLSKAAFNALLKTLEEPPLDVLFILATTETEKVPVTILSRCQHFGLKRLSVNDISEHLIKISKLEKINLDQECSTMIARSAEGSVRDALSILDNVFARGNIITKDLVKDVLCIEDFSNIIQLFKFICEAEVEKALKSVEKFYIDGCSFELIARDLLDITYQVTRIKCSNTSDDISLTDYELEEYRNFAKFLDMDVLIRMYEFMEKYFSELSNAFDQKKSFEMTVMRLCYIILLPSPFESEKNKLPKDDLFESDLDNTKKKENSTNEEENKIEKKLALTNNDKNSNTNNYNYNPDSSDKEKFKKFSKLVSIVESKGDLVLAHKLKNNFKLISIKDNEKTKPCELELENFKNEKIKSSQLWELSKMLENATKKRWIVSLSYKKGIETLSEIEMKKHKELISEISKESSIKKILEIIPNSKVTSIEKMEKK